MIVLCLMLSALSQATGSGGLGGGGPLMQGDRIPPAFEAKVHQVLERRRAANPVQPVLVQPPLLPFDPIGALVGGDVNVGNFVDLDPSFGKLDYSGHDFVNDGHQGHDISLKSFAEQALGVAVFAARDGTVALAQDGFGDMNLAPSGDDGNYVVVDHGDGTAGWYLHLKKNSVTVTAGQVVKAGQQLGLAASSGNSYGPHLHFQVEESNLPVEPASGPQNFIATRYARQDTLRLDTYVFEFAPTRTDLFNWPTGLPTPMPVDNQIPFSDTFTWYWFQGVNLTPNTSWRWIFLRPDGSVAKDESGPMGNPTWERIFWRWFYFYVPDMHTIAGTWHVKLELNGHQVVDAPIEVVATINPTLNRAPEPIGLAFEPAAPSPNAPLFCRIQGPLVIDDLDFDVVRYRYVWKVNGTTIRDVTTCGRGDCIPRNSAALGNTVSCTVTPSDGKVNGTPVTLSAVVADDRWTHLAHSKYGSGPAVPYLAGSGTLLPSSACSISLSQARPSSLCYLFVATSAGNAPLLAGTLVPFPILFSVPLFTDANGGFTIPFAWPTGIGSGFPLVLQAWVQDAGAKFGASASNGLRGVTP